MKITFGILTALAILSFLYFVFAAVAALGQARAEMKRLPPTKLSFLPSVLDSDCYTDRGKEWIAIYYRRWFLGFGSAVVMFGCGNAYVYLRDGGTVLSSLEFPVFVAMPEMLAATTFMAFFGSATWLLIGLGGAGLRRLRNRPTSDAQRRRISRSLKWTFGSFAIVVLSVVILQFRQG